jgi:hypothetical protein
MNRRNFLGSLIGGVAAGAAVRTWPFRVYSFPSHLFLKPFEIVNPVVGQSVYTTSAASDNFFHVGDITYVYPDQASVMAEIMGWRKWGKYKGKFLVTAVDPDERTLTIENIPAWMGLDRSKWPR